MPPEQILFSIASARLRCRVRLEFLSHPFLERVHILFAPEKILYQIVSSHRPTGLEHGTTISHRRLAREQVVVIKLAEEILGNHLVPQICVVGRGITLQMSKRRVHVSAWKRLEWRVLFLR